MTTTDLAPDLVPGLARYQSLRDAAAGALGSGDLETALRLYRDAEDEAGVTGDAALVRIACCNRAAFEIEIGERERPIAELRALLVASADPVSSHLAAYAIARGYELARNYRKAIFYARVAMQHLDRCGREDWRAESHNQLGNVLLAQSLFDQAHAEYQRALALMPPGLTWERAQVLDNVGYCQVVVGNVREGIGLLHESLRILRAGKARRYEISARADLCFAWLQAGRPHTARRHGVRSLALAEEFDDVEAIKNSLCLLVQLEQQDGQRSVARAYVDRLQRFYPDTPVLAELLLALDVRNLLSFRA